MTVVVGGSPAVPGTPTWSTDHHPGPPGERYYRHPGDVIRLCLWAAATALLLLFDAVATRTSDGVRADLAGIASDLAAGVRQLLLAGVQIGAVLVPLGAVAALAARRRWRRLATLIVAGGAGAATVVIIGLLQDDPPPVLGAIGGDAWVVSTSFPSLAYLGAAVAAGTVGKPWLSRRWRHALDASLVGLGIVMVVAGSAGVPELVVAAAAGGLAGAALLVAVGAPNRRPTPTAVCDALHQAGLPVDRLALERADGGRAQLYRAATPAGPVFAKVYGQDSRDADLLYRSFRGAVLRGASGAVSSSLSRAVEHEALLLLLAERGGVACPSLRAVVALPDASMVLAMEDVGGPRLDELPASELDDALLDDVWRQVDALHAAGLSHGALRMANVLVATGKGAVLIDFGAGTATTTARNQAMDRAELLASLAAVVGPVPAVASAARVLSADDLAAAMPYLQPLALSAATRRTAPKAMLRSLRASIAETTEHEPAPLEQLIRVRPRTVVMVATLTGAFYVLLPQLADVDDSLAALGSASWWWLTGTVVMSLLTYVFAAISTMGGFREPLPFVPTVQVAMASSFVNRVTPANVGGMALNVRFVQKAGIPPAAAVAGVGLNVAAGGVVHVVLLLAFLIWAGRSDAAEFSLPGGTTLLIAIPVVLALIGIVMATRWGRSFVRARVVPSIAQSMAAIRSVARSPARVGALFGGSIGVTMAYATALACAVAAFDGEADFAQVGAVYLGASLLAAAAPTPGGLGAMEAGLVAGFTGVGMEPAIAVAAVLSYRLLTFWLPVLPGWLCFHLLDRHNYI